jgi:hypothetical protein
VAVVVGVVVAVPPEAVYTVEVTPLDKKGEGGLKDPPRVEENNMGVTESFTGFPCPSLAVTIRVVLPPSGTELLEVVIFKL